MDVPTISETEIISPLAGSDAETHAQRVKLRSVRLTVN